MLRPSEPILRHGYGKILPSQFSPGRASIHGMESFALHLVMECPRFLQSRDVRLEATVFRPSFSSPGIWVLLWENEAAFHERRMSVLPTWYHLGPFLIISCSDSLNLAVASGMLEALNLGMLTETSLCKDMMDDWQGSSVVIEDFK